MASNPPPSATGPSTGQAGILFGPNTSGKSYLSTYVHRGSGNLYHKSQWASNIAPPTEYDIFNTSDNKDWFDVDGHFWGLLDSGNTIIGMRGERLCKFPNNTNPNTPWHGYPVSPSEQGTKDQPYDKFIDKWIDKGVVTKTFGRRIQRGKV